MIIDLHSHLIPGVDDGAKNLEASVELARLGETEGVTHIVLTPHHRNGQYINYGQDVIKASQNIQEEYRKDGIAIKVFPAQEIRIHEDLLDSYYNGELLSLDGDGRYYLLEFPTQSIPAYSLDLVNTLLAQGIIPVIAHPERNHVFAKDLELFAKFIEAGCLGQLTSSCYSGYYGQQLQDYSRQMIEANLVHIIASDVHHKDHRPFNMKAAFDLMYQEYGKETVEYFKQNARHIFNGDDVSRKAINLPGQKRKRWFGLF